MCKWSWLTMEWRRFYVDPSDRECEAFPEDK